LTAVELQNRINEATKEVARNYQKALKELGELKTKINGLELVIADNVYGKTSGDVDKLNFALDELFNLTDFMIAESERAREEYEKLEHDCRIDASEPLGLKDLRDLCKKTDEFATDLLCYSLAHFKRIDTKNNQKASTPKGPRIS